MDFPLTDNPNSDLTPPTGEQNLSANAARVASGEAFAIVGIGASTGGLEAVTVAFQPARRQRNGVPAGATPGSSPCEHAG